MDDLNKNVTFEVKKISEDNDFIDYGVWRGIYIVLTSGISDLLSI